MTISAWWLLILAIPALMLGEFLVRRIHFLSRFNIPAPVVGGLIISLLVLIGNLTGMFSAKFTTKVDDKWWTWLVTPEAQWLGQLPRQDIHRPFMVGFFTCIGLNASWSLIRKGGVLVVIFLVIGTILAVLQNVVGVALAKALDVSPLLGVVCGALTLTGGHATALGFAPEFEKVGLQGAAVLGAAAATFGLIAGGLIGGPIGGGLIRKHKLKSTARTEVHLEAGEAVESGILSDFRALIRCGIICFFHFLLLLACIKLGSWISYYIQKATVPMPTFNPSFSIQNQPLTFPVYMGAMLLGVVIRNCVDALGKTWIRTEIVDTLASVLLGVFLTIAMMSLNILELAGTAGPMLVILTVQVVMMALFAWFITFRFMGKDFEAAVTAGGHCGFGLGATPNAIANMKSLVETFGPAPRAFLVVPIVGAFLLDFLNAMNITIFINLLK